MRRELCGIALIASVLVTTLLYLFVSLLSVSAYPPEYENWLAYIRDMGNLDGIKAVPAFYAADHYLGQTGVAILMLALFAVILTSLIGNMLALSRLLYAAGRDGEAPRFLSKLSDKGIPHKAVYCIAAVSVLIPFLGRTAIGWIVDVTTLGATLIYGLISHAVYRHAKQNKLHRARYIGMVGMALMFCFGLLLLIPGLLPFDAMETESYILFIVWAVFGLAYFQYLFYKDQNREYGQRVIVWVILLVLVIFASMMWVSRATENAANEAVERIYSYHQSHPSVDADENSEEARAAFLQQQADQISSTNTLYSIVSLGLFILCISIMLNNYRQTQKLGKRLLTAEKNAATDQLTGIQNRWSYAEFEQRINKQIEDDTIDDFAVIICDINDLKTVNDTLGHNKGDESIRCASAMLCKTFSRSPVFRIGGDEFCILLTGDDFANRYEHLTQIDDVQTKDLQCRPGAAIAVGMSEYIRGEDKSVLEVFVRADHIMYARKNELKKRLGKLS